MNRPIELLLVDDHALFREGLSRVLEGEQDLTVTAAADTAAKALSLLDKHKPDIILLDVDLGGERAIDFVYKAWDAGFSGKILVVTAGVSDAEAVQFVQAGVAGIIHKHSQPATLCDAVRQVARGENYLEARYLKPIFQKLDTSAQDGSPQLSDREVLMIRLIFEGLSNKEIGERLSLSESAVKAALRVLFDKLGVRTRSQLVKVALEQYRDQL
jgi:two-component system nitrate/nitrite response regulator NarL